MQDKTLFLWNMQSLLTRRDTASCKFNRLWRELEWTRRTASLVKWPSDGGNVVSWFPETFSSPSSVNFFTSLLHAQMHM